MGMGPCVGPQGELVPDTFMCTNCRPLHATMAWSICSPSFHYEHHLAAPCPLATPRCRLMQSLDLSRQRLCMCDSLRTPH